MGLETLDGFRDSISLALGEKRQGNERLDRWVNDGQIELFAELDIQGRRTCATTSTVVDQQEYDTPTDFLATLVLKNTTTKKRLIKTAIENFLLLDDTLKGSPTRYARVDNILFTHPIPNVIEALQMFYIKEPAIMVLGTDLSELPAVYDRVIHLLALRNALIDLKDNDRATFIFQVGVNKLAKIPVEEWLEGQVPQEGVAIARSFRDLQRDPRQGFDDRFLGRVL